MVSEITSVHNERVKYVRSLARRRVRQREGRFVVEGTRLVDEVVRAGIRPALVLYTEAWAASLEAKHLAAGAGSGRGVAPGRSASRCLAACADTQTPQGVLAVVPFVAPLAAPRASS